MSIILLPARVSVGCVTLLLDITAWVHEFHLVALEIFCGMFHLLYMKLSAQTIQTYQYGSQQL